VAGRVKESHALSNGAHRAFDKGLFSFVKPRELAANFLMQLDGFVEPASQVPQFHPIRTHLAVPH
jgi:hypothetical protein